MVCKLGKLVILTGQVCFHVIKVTNTLYYAQFPFVSLAVIWQHFSPFNFHFLTIVVNVFGLLFGLIQRNAINFHPYQGVYNGPIFLLYFRELLSTNNLKRDENRKNQQIKSQNKLAEGTQILYLTNTIP